MVAGRCVVLLGTSARCRATFTGRPEARAPSAARTASARRNSLAPKPPPMYGDTRRTFSFGMPSVLASSPRVQSIIWLEVQTVRLSPSHAAMVAWGSIIAWDSLAVV